MPLSDLGIRRAQAKAKAYKLYDGQGLYLLVNPKAAKYWRYDYRYQAKRKTLALGVYPRVGLKTARQRLESAKQQLDQGIDPCRQRQLLKLTQGSETQANSFELIAREWHQRYLSTWSPAYAQTILYRLEVNIFPVIGFRSIGAIEPLEVLAALRKIEARGALHTAHRIQAICGRIFRYAVATGRAKYNPARDLQGALPPAQSTHFASLTDRDEIGELLRAIQTYHGDYTTLYALRLLPYIFVRPGELRHASWDEIDFEQQQWRIPAEKMKMKREHIVPLSRQSLEILQRMHSLNASRPYIFSSLRSPKRPISNNTLNAALRRLGYRKDQMTAHGFRSMASTQLNELGFKSDLIEKQLAHEEKNAIRAAYNRAEYLPERTQMMQQWADYLDDLKTHSYSSSVTTTHV